MRIAVANWSSRLVGGTEDYLDEVIPELHRLGHAVALLCEFDEPVDRRRIHLPQGCPVFCVSEAGAGAALAGLREWRPDLIYAHKFDNPAFQELTLDVAPGVFFVHDYYGTCISGAKTFKFPIVKPCDRTFGWRCLVHYFPHRCGGLSPVTMWSLFRLQSRRLELLRRYGALLTHSDHMRSEFLKHGFSPEVVHKSSYLVADDRLRTESSVASRVGRASGSPPDCRLLFIGRMDRLKGGSVLLDALPLITARLLRPLRLVFAGDGPERVAWEKSANRIQASHHTLSVEFTGWQDKAGLDKLLDESDLLVVPSLWPEPFGRVGPEAGLHSLPAAAFAVGGIPEWLIDGVNGYLAPGDPPTPAGLAEAIVRCLRDPASYEQLRRGALNVAGLFGLVNHMGQLIQLFENVACVHRSREIEPGNGAPSRDDETTERAS